MLQIGGTLVSLDVIERSFACNLPACKGACCVEGDSGAPLEKQELAELQNVLPVVWNDLSLAAQVVIREKGVAYIDVEGDTVTSIVNGKDCVFTCYDANGACKCAIEKAFHEGRTRFPKPISCRLYPIRVKEYATYKAVNYNRWRICKSAEALGVSKKIYLYQYLREPLISKFGQAWYDELELCAKEWMAQFKQE